MGCNIMEYAVETFSLTKIFSDWWGRDKICAVDNLNLKVRYGEVFGLLGPNGSGKTTTLKMLLGLLYPTKGKAVVLGGDGTEPKINARIGFLPEESYLYRYLNARETLDFYGRLFGLPAKVRKIRIEALLDMVGLKAVANRSVGTYSKGMARRIGLAQALINDPDLLILDEPTAGMDPIGTRQIKDLILELAKRGKTILLCSHLLADVEDVCDRIAILYGGRIQAEGQVKDLLLQTNKKQIITDAISNTAVERIKQIVHEEKADCVVTSPMDKLETFFIKTVVAAQQTLPTSGAISTTQIGDFLAQKASKESILDKLVAAPVSDATAEHPPTKQPVVPAESSEVKPDEQLLQKLTGTVEPAQPTPLPRKSGNKSAPAPAGGEKVKTEQVGPQPETLQQQQREKTILDQLTGRSTNQNDDSKSANNRNKSQPGDTSDA